MIKQAVAVVMAFVVLTVILAHPPTNQIAHAGIYTGENSELTVQIAIIQPLLSTSVSPTELGAQVTLTGILHSAAETPTCVKHPSCGLPSVEFSYLTSGQQNYRLLGGAVSQYPDGTKVTVTGWLRTPSSWKESSLYQPTLTFAGDITVIKTS